MRKVAFLYAGGFPCPSESFPGETQIVERPRIKQRLSCRAAGSELDNFVARSDANVMKILNRSREARPLSVSVPLPILPVHAVR